MRTRRSQSSGNPVSGRPGSPAGHRTVLLHEAVEALEIKGGDTVVDMTLGAGGHAREILKRLTQGRFIGFDADQDAVERVRKDLAGDFPDAQFIHANFRHIASELAARDVTRVTKVLFDLGWSGYQLTGGRGFSFLSDEPLGMAYGKGSVVSAGEIVNSWGEESIADVIFGWGEDRYSRRIAKAIVEAREKAPIKTARELGEIVKAAYPGKLRVGKTHPATKTFQALRIAVNDELGALEEGLSGAWHLLEPGGRIAVVSFHSIEDRIVKRRFLEWEKAGEGRRTTKKPMVPSAEEISDNPRARSAKLRVIEKEAEIT